MYEELVLETLNKLKEQHFRFLPYLFLSFVGNGLLFLLLYYNFDASLLGASYSLEVLLLISILISSIGYFVFTLFGFLWFAANKKPIAGDIFNMSMLSNYLFIAFVLIAKFMQVGLLAPYFGVKSIFDNFITNVFIVCTLAIILCCIQAWRYRHKEKDLKAAYGAILESERIVKNFITDSLNKGKVEIISSQKEVENGKGQYETIAKIKKGKIRVVQDKNNQIIEWEYLTRPLKKKQWLTQTLK
jgi:magnesium-transporting ATPase (P-type)